MPIPVVAVLLVVVFALGWLVCWSRAYNDPTSLTHWKIEARKWEHVADVNRRDLVALANRLDYWRKLAVARGRSLRSPRPPNSVVDPITLPPEPRRTA